MNTRALSLIVVAIASTALLSGCGPSGVPTATADAVATTAENALEETVGSRPDIDCGTEDVELKVGNVVDCVLTDPISGEKFEAPVTVESVKDGTYTVGVKVGNAPIGAPDPEPTVVPDAVTGDPTVPSNDIADLAEGALEGIVGFTPALTCGDDDVAIFVGNTTECSYDDADGVTHDVVVEITEFDGSSYTINAQIVN